MHELQTFDFNTNAIRITDIDGNPWFIAADVCRAVGYAVKSNGAVNTTNALQCLDADEVITAQISKTSGRPPKLISESGVYKLVMRSDKPEARSFQNWVTKTVLPAIRKDGGYIMGEEKVVSGEMSEDELIARAVVMAQAKIERLKQEVAEVTDQRDVLASTIAEPSRTIGKIARTLEGVNINKIKSDLHKLGYLYRRAGQYRVYAKHRTFFLEKFNGHTGYSEIVVTEEGARLLSMLRTQGKLTMRAGYQHQQPRLQLVG